MIAVWRGSVPGGGGDSGGSGGGSRVGGGAAAGRQPLASATAASGGSGGATAFVPLPLHESSAFWPGSTHRLYGAPYNATNLNPSGAEYGPLRGGGGLSRVEDPWVRTRGCQRTVCEGCCCGIGMHKPHTGKTRCYRASRRALTRVTGRITL